MSRQQIENIFIKIQPRGKFYLLSKSKIVSKEKRKPKKIASAPNNKIIQYKSEDDEFLKGICKVIDCLFSCSC